MNDDFVHFIGTHFITMDFAQAEEALKVWKPPKTLTLADIEEAMTAPKPKPLYLIQTPPTAVHLSMPWVEEYYNALVKKVSGVNSFADEVLGTLHETFNGLLDTVACPAAGLIHARCPADTVLTNIITHLNDFHRWSYDAIADWLETLDNDLTVKEQ